MTAILAIAASNAIISAVLALVTFAVTRYWRSPQLAHGLWLLVLLKLITPPLITVSPPGEWLAMSTRSIEPSPRATVGVGGDELHSPVELNTHASASIATTEIALVDSPAAMPRGDDEAIATSAAAVVPPRGFADRASDFAAAHWLTALGVAWLVGALVYLSLLVCRCVSFRRVLATSVEAEPDLASSAMRLAAKLGLRRCPPLRVVDAPIPPLVWSLGLRALIVLPARLMAELTPAQSDALVAHELAHVRRRDYFVRWLEVIALVAFWWNPIAWFARRKLREAEEECCDAWVIWALPGERRSYGQAMLATIEFLTDGPKLPALAASTFGGSFCKRRIEMIMKRNRNRRISWTALGIVLLMAVAVLPIVAQTTEPVDAQSVAQPEDAAAAAASAADAVGSLDDGIQNAADVSNAAIEAAGSSSDATSATNKAVEPAKTSGTARRTKSADAEKGPSDASTKALLNRISRLEQLLEDIATERVATNASPRIGGSLRVSNRNAPADKQEQDLDEQLLKLDVDAAKADLEPARIKLERSLEANKKQPGSISELLVAQQQAELFQKQVQLKRAETLLERHQRQAQTQRNENARLLQKQRSSIATARNRQLTESTRRAQRADQLARLKELNKQIADELVRLENLLKESPDAPETWQAVEEFLKTYPNLPQPGAESISSLQRYPGGSAN